MAQHNITGLGLGLPHSELARSSEPSRRSHERSRSLHDSTYSQIRSADQFEGRSSRPRSIYSGNQSLHSMDATHAMELDAAATMVVGAVPRPISMESIELENGLRSFSDATSTDGEHYDPKHAHIRAQSAPTMDIPGDIPNPLATSIFPRADSLLRLDSNCTSKDLRKLLTTRVRHAPSSIDTNKANASGISSSSSSPIKNDPRASQLEPEKSRPRVEVYLVLNNQVAVEGGSFSGTLTVRTRKPRRGEARHVRIDGGKIRIIGFEGVSETERYAFYQCSSLLSETSEECSQLYEPGSNNDNDGFRIAREGTYSLPFTVHIPRCDSTRPHRNIPKGVIQDNGINAAIKYILLISFKVKDDADNSSGIDKNANLASVSIAHFYRSVELWPTYGPMALHIAEEAHPALGEIGTVSSRTARGLLFGGAGMLHLTAVLHRKVWLAGQKCVVYIGAWNETNKSIKTVTLAIIRKATITRPNQNASTNKKQIVETTLDAVRGSSFGPVTGKGWWAGIEPGATCEFSHAIEIPADALTVNRTHVIEVSYTLRVTLVTGSLSSNVSVDLPFRIINAISTDGLPVPPPPGLLIGSLKLPNEVPVSFAFDVSSRHDPTTLDQRIRSFSGSSWSKTSDLQGQDVLGWTRRAPASGSPTSDEINSGLRGFMGDANHLERVSQISQISQVTSTSHQLFDGVAPGDSVSRLMSELESEFNAQEHPSSHQSSQRSSVASSSILKSAPSTKHRVTFLTPKSANARTMEESSAMRRDIEQTVMEPRELSGYPKEPPSRRFALQDNHSNRAQSGRTVSQPVDMWNDEDANEVLRSLRMDDGGFDSFHSRAQELIFNGRNNGPVTGSSTSSDPWSASGSSYSQPSASYPSSAFETSPEQEVGISYGRPHSVVSTSRSQADSMLKDDTPRAGYVARFKPEIVTGSIRTSSSRAALVPTISSPMLAKSQSAHFVGSPVNQYRRISPQLVAAAQLGDDHSKTAGNMHTAFVDTRAAGEQSSIRAVTGERSAIVSSDSARHSVLLPPSSSTLTVASNAKAHLRSRSGPESTGDHPSNANVPNSDTPSKSTVRSRVAALEERSRSRPVSQYSNASSVNSMLLYK